ncbi:Oxalate decarboxylase OxdC [Cladophialophora carrionii]|uniref:Oxalate decarboxylase OxdC n=1 Tax=Cladophialophora carrionii TaxID=86049 RepID=A0A1C1CKL1_9EURO|nr:Oxalate decarboxylase OxdC [Cladophialophora carrionii]
MSVVLVLALACYGAFSAPTPQQSGGVSGGEGGSDAQSSGSALQASSPMTLTSGGRAWPTTSLLGPENNIVSATAESANQPTYTLVPNQEAPADNGMILDFTNEESPQAIRGDNGASDFTGFNAPYDRLNPNAFARPGTDAGDSPNFKWPMGLSSARSGTGGGNPGYARQQNIDELPISQSMAGVDMRLAPNAHRELHWHSANEWSYVFNGSARISAVDPAGRTYVDDIQAGDLWFFPAGIPHSIQASPDGVEFLLVFSQGDFSEDATDLVSELFLRNPKEVLAKNFQTDISDFDNLPQDEKYIFNAAPYPENLTEVQQSVLGPTGQVPSDQAYTYHLSQQEPLQVPGGSIKIVDPTVFPVAENFSVGFFTIEPGAMREIHWHLTSDEWNFFLAGNARITSFTAPESSRTFDFQAGDVGYIPVENAHYIENTGNTTVSYMEVLQAPQYQDMSVSQWLGLTPANVVADTLHLPQSLISRLPKVKNYIVPGNANYSTTNFTVEPSAVVKRKEPMGYSRSSRLF